jgi:hypothetical protein
LHLSWVVVRTWRKQTLNRQQGRAWIHGGSYLACLSCPRFLKERSQTALAMVLTDPWQIDGPVRFSSGQATKLGSELSFTWKRRKAQVTGKSLKS